MTTYSRAGFRWTVNEILSLQREFELLELSIDEIAEKHNRSPERLKQIFKECCAKTLYTLLNGKLYTCPFIANAGELRAIPENKADYVDLNLEPENLGEKIRKLVKKKTFFPACDFCDGRPHDPSKALEYAGKGLIKAGIQLNRSQKIPFNKF